MLVQDIMSRNVVSVFLETKLAEVATILFGNKFNGVPVVENGKPVGIVTGADFFTKDSNIFLPSYVNFIEKNKIMGELSNENHEKVEKLLNLKAKDIMTSNCESVLGSMSLEKLILFFKVTQYKTIPVIDETGKLVGIVTRSDILKLITV
jgi:CBS domain-containing protein